MKTYKKCAFNTFNMREKVYYKYSGLQLQMSAAFSWVSLCIFLWKLTHLINIQPTHKHSVYYFKKLKMMLYIYCISHNLTLA